ncbi:MAG: hypothetical protein GY853_06595 [PVC group bacterium]|nr:hypothetical protein [PVC group bacterium]
MKKHYCKDCVSFHGDGYNMCSMGECQIVKIVKSTYYSANKQKVWLYRDPAIENKNNDCPDFISK